MIIELNIGKIWVTGLPAIRAENLRIAVAEALEILLSKAHFPETVLKNSTLTYPEMAFEIEAHPSIQKIAQQIAHKILIALQDRSHSS